MIIYCSVVLKIIAISSRDVLWKGEWRSTEDYRVAKGRGNKIKRERRPSGAFICDIFSLIFLKERLSIVIEGVDQPTCITDDKAQCVASARVSK